MMLQDSAILCNVSRFQLTAVVAGRPLCVPIHAKARQPVVLQCQLVGLRPQKRAVRRPLRHSHRRRFGPQPGRLQRRGHRSALRERSQRGRVYLPWGQQGVTQGELCAGERHLLPQEWICSIQTRANGVRGVSVAHPGGRKWRQDEVLWSVHTWGHGSQWRRNHRCDDRWSRRGLVVLVRHERHKTLKMCTFLEFLRGKKCV